MKPLFTVLMGVMLGCLMATQVHAEDKAVLAFVGDVMLAKTEGTGRLIARGGDPLKKVRKALSAADLRVANFESAAGRTGKADPAKPFSFRTTPAGIKVFSSVFEVAGLANNHSGDFGRQALLETMQSLRHSGSLVFGAGKDLMEAHQALIVERNGVRIALLGYLDFLPRWFAAGPGLAGAAWLDPRQVVVDIAKARSQGADVVIAVPHWGQEHEPLANDHQRTLARILIDAGADAVIGGHPHVVQDHEIYRGKPIMYSLGNFVFDGFTDEDNNTGWMVFADVSATGVTAIRTRVVTIDAKGSPALDSSKSGPCWTRDQASMTRCPG